MPAKRLLLEISRCNQRCISQTGDIDPSKVAALIEAALSSDHDRPRLILGLGEFIGAALSGNVINPAKATKP